MHSKGGASEEVRSKLSIPWKRDDMLFEKPGERGLRKSFWKRQEDYAPLPSAGRVEEVGAVQREHKGIWACAPADWRASLQTPFATLSIKWPNEITFLTLCFHGGVGRLQCEAQSLACGVLRMWGIFNVWDLDTCWPLSPVDYVVCVGIMLKLWVLALKRPGVVLRE